MFGFKMLQVRLEHSKEKIDIIRWLRDFENSLIRSVIRKMNRESQLAGDEINAAQAERELFEKSPKDKQQRLCGFDLVIELKTIVERFRWLNKFEQPRRGPIRTFPKLNGSISEPIPEFLFIE